MSTKESTKVIPVSGEAEKSINVLDIIKYLLYYWKWYMLVICLFVFYFYYEYSKTQYVYQQSMNVMIKTPTNAQLSMRLSRYSGLAPVNVTNEILQFKSKELMRKVVRQLNTNINYTINQGLRENELYRQSPIRVEYDKDKDVFISMWVKLEDNGKLNVTLWPKSPNEKTFQASFNQKFEINDIALMISSTDKFSSGWIGKTIKVQIVPVNSAAAMFSNNLAISQTREDASVITFSLNDYSTSRAADILHEMVIEYNKQTIEDKTKVAINTEAFIKERLALIEEELNSVESQLEQKKVENGGEDLSSYGDRYLSESISSEGQIKQLETQIYLANMVKDYLQNSLKDNDLIPVNMGLEDANINLQINQYNDLLLKRNRFVDSGNEQNPIVEELNNSLKELRKNINLSVDNILSNLSTTKGITEEEMYSARSIAQEMPGKLRQLLTIERERKVKDDLYVFLLNRREENALSRVTAEDNAQFVDLPSGSSAPVSPVLYKKLAIAIGCGLLFPSVVLLIILMLDTNVRTRKEIEDVVDVPFLAEIPFSKDVQGNDNQITIRSQGHDSLSESFRILRTNLGFMGVDTEPQRVITFTSFSSGAGKTFSSVNVAASLIQINKKVVIVDLDLRKGTLSFDADVKTEKGITHYLSDSTLNVDDIIIKDKPGIGIDMVPIGIIAPNPVELLLSKRLDQLISELKIKYDYIVVDNVPLGVVADSTIINRITDITIFVVRSGKLDKRQLPELQRIYEEKRLTNMAVLLNGVKPSGHNYGYGYGYGGYGYGSYGGYGYGKKKKSWWNFWT